MVRQGFYVGEGDWWVMVYYNVGEDNLREVFGVLLASGASDRMAQRACIALSRKNSGYTFTNYDERATIILISVSTTDEQLYDTIQHELKHAVEHIGEYYGVDPLSETSAYLQGEIARKMYRAASLVVCPCRNV